MDTPNGREEERVGDCVGNVQDARDNWCNESNPKVEEANAKFQSARKVESRLQYQAGQVGVFSSSSTLV
tara:strand:+ start:144 stop:350 length:207 start_codon:yes stop_codon:yes gene_type:complete